MESVNEEIYQIKFKMNERERLKSLLTNTETQLKSLKSKKAALFKQLEKEELDVKKLEGVSFANLIHIIAGDKFDKLEKEKQEALSAKLKYDEACAGVNSLEEEVGKINSRLSELRDIDSRYMELISQKEKTVNSSASSRLSEIIEEKAKLKSMEKELDEALGAGYDLVSSLEQVRESLNSASNWGTWDMLGGGLLADMAKHSRIDEARSGIDHAQSLLRRFERELRDVGGVTDLSIDIGSFMTFADYFFDGLFVDWSVQSKIHDAQDRVEDTIRKVNSIIGRMESDVKRTNSRMGELERERISIIEQA